MKVSMHLIGALPLLVLCIALPADEASLWKNMSTHTILASLVSTFQRQDKVRARLMTETMTVAPMIPDSRTGQEKGIQQKSTMLFKKIFFVLMAFLVASTLLVDHKILASLIFFCPSGGTTRELFSPSEISVHSLQGERVKLQNELSQLRSEFNILVKNLIVNFPIDPDFPLNPNRKLATFREPAAVAGTKIWAHDPYECFYMSRWLVQHGQWEPHRQERLMSHLPPNKRTTLFVDIGGNIGTFSIVMAAAGYDVEAIEPMQYNVELFSNSIKENGFQDFIKLFQIAAGEVPKSKVCLQAAGSTEEKPNQSNGQVIAGANDTGGNCVPMMRLDSIVSRCPDLVKVDVEGLEVSALKSLGVSSEGKCRPKGIAVEDNSSTGASSVKDHLVSLGYNCQNIGGRDCFCTYG